MKKILNRNYKKVLILSSLVIILYLNFITFGNKNTYLNIDETTEIIQDNNIRSHGLVYDYYTQEWLTNGNFTGGTDPWYSTTEGDTSDVNATSSPGVASFEVLGEERTFSLIADPPDDVNWTDLENPAFPTLPDTYIIDTQGCKVSHQWDESPDQAPSVHWEKNVSMPVNMSDYIITSASISAVVNGTVTASPGGWQQWGIDVPGDTMDQHSTYDYVRFYVLVSDLEKNKVYEVAYNQTVDLGKDSAGATDSMGNTFMTTVPEEILKFYLTSVLSTDYFNFTVTLGMRIRCEDNFHSDSDDWNELRINSFNLTFKYEKEIDQSTSVSWNQIGNKITGDDIDISNATLNFKYIIDQNWIESSPNSEIRIFITNRSYVATIKLSTVSTSFQDANFDVTSLILKDENISVTIQVYLADTFGLGQKYNISIDNVSLMITYSITTVEIETDFELFLNGEDKTLGKSIIVPLGDLVNITFKYTNKSGDFIPNANVSITTPEGTFDLDEDDILEFYNITIDTKFFQIGDNFLSLSADKKDHENRKYYEKLTIYIDIICSEIATNLDEIYLNQTLTTLIAFPYGDLLNITAVYKEEATGDFIDGATVQLLNGTDVLDNFTKHQTLNQYNLTINTTILGAEANTYTIFAKRDNYSAAIESIITIIQRQTTLNLTINSTQISNYDTYELQVNESIILIVKYFDYFTGDHIDNATVELSGAGLSENLTEYNKEFNITLFSENLTKGFNFLTIIAQKENTMPQAISFSINVIERKTEMVLFINETDITSNKTYTMQVGDIIDIIVNYTDYTTGEFLNNTIIEITGGGISANLTEYINHYKITISAENLTKSINFLSIFAEKKNYQPQVIDFRIDIIQRETYLKVFLNKISTTSCELTAGETLKVVIEYRDYETDEFLDSALVNIIGEGIFKNLTKHPSKNQYSIILGTSELGIGIKSLTISAQQEKYQISTESLAIIVTYRPTSSAIFLNQINKTFDKSIELAIGSELNITYKYIDNITGDFISSAFIQLIGKDKIWNLTENSSLNQYSLEIKSRDLGIGVFFLTILAQKTNFQSTSDVLRINIRQIKTNVTTESGNEIINIQVGESYYLSIVLYDLDFGGMIKNATVGYSWLYGQGYLTDEDNDGTYTGLLENIPEGTFTITITVSSSNSDYIFEQKTITLNSYAREAEPIFLWLLIFAVGVIIALGSYFIAYQRVLKYPKPVRKVHKFKRTLKRKSAPSVEITSRDDSFKSLHKEGLGKVSRFKPGKLEDKLPSLDIKSEAKFAEETPSTETQPEDKSTEKSLVSDEKLKKKSDKSKDKTLNKSSKTDN